MLCCKKKSMDKKPEAIVPFPDGGWGWFVCMATFTTQFIVLGTMNNFGVIYVELLKEFKNIGKDEAGNENFFHLASLIITLRTKTTCKWVLKATIMICCCFLSLNINWYHLPKFRRFEHVELFLNLRLLLRDRECCNFHPVVRHV